MICDDRGVLFIQNDPEVPAGTYGLWLGEMGIPHQVVTPFSCQELPSVAGVAAVIVLGGSMGVYDTDRHPFLARVKGFIAEAVQREVPYLGICLGGQLLADVLGAAVHAGRWGELGVGQVSLLAEGAADPLFRSLPGEIVSFQWHNDSFDIPDGAVRLAYSAACPHQAFRYGRTGYGLQFHPEMDEATVRSWCGDLSTEGARAERIVARFREREAEYRGFSRTLLKNFLRIAGVHPSP